MHNSRFSRRRGRVVNTNLTTTSAYTIWSPIGRRELYRTYYTERTWLLFTCPAWKRQTISVQTAPQTADQPMTSYSSEVCCYITCCCSNLTLSKYPNSDKLVTIKRPRSSVALFTRPLLCWTTLATHALSGMYAFGTVRLLGVTGDWCPLCWL